MLVLYDTLLSLLTWTVLVPVELVRIVCGRSTRQRLQQRLGSGRPLSSQSHPEAGAQASLAGPLLVHAVSAGEMQAAGILVTAVTTRLPALDVVLTAGAEDGLHIGEAIRRRCPHVRSVELLPWDRRRGVEHFLQRLRPRLVLVVETEIWPALITACAKRRIPLWLVSGRLSPRDVGRYRLALGFFRRLLERVSWIGVQTEEQRRRFLAIGAPAERVEVVGSLKYGALVDGAPKPTAAVDSGGRDSLLVAVSTHHPEERALLDAVSSLRRDGRTLRLVLAPRKVHRATGLCDAARRRGLQPVLLGELDGCAPGRRADAAPWEVLIVDHLGALGPWLAASDLVFVGGSLVPHGGHNPLEPAAVGGVVVTGPFTRNFAEETAGLEAAGGLVRIAAAAELEPRIASLLDHDAQRRDLGARAAAFVASRRPQATAYADRVAAVLDESPAPSRA